MDAMTALLTRRTVRRYTGAQVRHEDLGAILDCGRLAPSAANRQEWRFVAITDAELLGRIAGMMEYGKHIADAGAAVAIFTGPDCLGPLEDAPAAATCMLLAAHALGYGACWVGIHDNPSYLQVAGLLGAPEDWPLRALLCIGVPSGDPPGPVKKGLESVVSYNGF